MDIGELPPPQHTIAHLSDPHLISGGYRVYGEVDPQPGFALALERLRHLPTPPEAIVFTGDLADLAQEAAYEQLITMVGPVAAELGAEVVWVMGNHDARAAYSRLLFGEESEGPQDRVHDIGGLRIVVLDTTVPGWHHGALDDDQLSWLTGVLGTPAQHGTLLAMHHPPAPTPLERGLPGETIQLDRRAELAEVLAGSDVRSILAGHLHYSASTTFAGIPVSIASASCYTVDHAPRSGNFTGVDGNGSFSIVHLYPGGVPEAPGGPVVHTTIPLAEQRTIVEYTPAAMEALAQMSFADRRELFSRGGKQARAARREWRRRHN